MCWIKMLPVTQLLVTVVLFFGVNVSGDCNNVVFTPGSPFLVPSTLASCLFSTQATIAIHNLSPTTTRGLKQSIDKQMLGSHGGIAKNEIARLTDIFFSTEGIHVSYVIALCMAGLKAYIKPKLKLTTEGNTFCTELKEKSIKYCTSTYSDRSRQACTAQYTMLELMTQKKPTIGDPSRKYLIQSAIVFIETSNVYKWFHPEQQTPTILPTLIEEVEVEVDDNTVPRVGPGIIKPDQTCQIDIHNKLHTLKISKLLTAAVDSSTKCRNENVMKPKDCRNNVMSSLSPFMTYEASSTLFGCSHRNTKDARKHAKDHGFCYPRTDEQIALDKKRIHPGNIKKCPGPKYIDAPCYYSDLKFETLYWWKKYSKASSTRTVKGFDRDGNEEEVFLMYLLHEPEEIWLHYDAQMTNECCRLSRSAFLATKPIGYQIPTKQVCLCDICGKSIGAIAEIASNFGDPSSSLSTYLKVYSGGTPLCSFIEIERCKLKTNVQMNAPITFKPHTYAFNPPSLGDNTLDPILTGSTGVRVAVSHIVLVAAQNTPVPSAYNLGVAFSHATSYRMMRSLFLINSLGRNHAWNRVKKLISDAGGIDSANEDVNENVHGASKNVGVRLFFSNAADKPEAHYAAAAMTVKTQFETYPDPKQTFKKGAAVTWDDYITSGGSLATLRRAKKRRQEEIDAEAPIEPAGGINQTPLPAAGNHGPAEHTHEHEHEHATCDATDGTCTLEGKSCDVPGKRIKDMRKRKSQRVWPEMTKSVTCSSNSLRKCLNNIFIQLREYEAPGLRFNRMVSIALRTATKEVGVVTLLPDGKIMFIGLGDMITNTNEEGETNKKQFHIIDFGLFRESGSTRLSEWFVKHSAAGEDLVLSFHVHGPNHVFGPSAPMLTISDPILPIEIIPDFHYSAELLPFAVDLQRLELDGVVRGDNGQITAPVLGEKESVGYSARLHVRTKLKRLEILEERAGIDFWSHKFETVRQQESYNKQREDLCKIPGMVILMHDYKRNIALVQTPWQLKRSYYVQATAAFYGLAVQYCTVGPFAIEDEPPEIKTLYLDVTSTNHNKNGPWVNSALEIAIGAAKAKMYNDPTFNKAEETTTSTVFSGMDTLLKIKEILSKARYIQFWSDNGGK